MTHAEARQILGVYLDAPRDMVKARYRYMAALTHPDNGGDPKDFRRICEAYDALQRPEPLTPGARAQLEREKKIVAQQIVDVKARHLSYAPDDYRRPLELDPHVRRLAEIEAALSV